MRLEHYLERLRAGGGHDSGSVFTLDAGDARQRFARSGPAYIQRLLQAAVAAGAEEAFFESGRDRLSLTFTPRRPLGTVAEQLVRRPLDPSTPAALLAAAMLECGCEADFHSDEEYLRVSQDGVRFLPSSLQGRPVRLEFRKRRRSRWPWGAAQFLPEIRHLQQTAPWAPLPVTCDDRVLNDSSLGALPTLLTTREDRSGLRHFRWLYWWTDLRSADWAIPFPASAFLEIEGATVDLSHGDVILHSLVPPPGVDVEVADTVSPVAQAPDSGLFLSLADEGRGEDSPRWLNAPPLDHLPGTFKFAMPAAGFSIAREHRVRWLRGYGRLPHFALGRGRRQLLGRRLLALPLDQEQASQLFVVDRGILLTAHSVSTRGPRFLAVVAREELKVDLAGRSVIEDERYLALLGQLEEQARLGCRAVLPILDSDGFGLSPGSRARLNQRLAGH